MNEYNGVEIAVIGMSGQFPGAGNLDEYWKNLSAGKESVSFHSREELVEAGVPAEMVDDPLFVKASCYLDGKEYFDSRFFDYIPSEAAIMDPQIRIFHENCWKALEDAGYDVRNNKEKIGLFAGGAINTNWENYCSLMNGEEHIHGYAAGNLTNVIFLCMRVSYMLDLRGPSVFINTTCSTSLVAVQKACMSLLLRECNMALAGGVRINNSSKSGYFYQAGMINSQDGHCRPFDAEASGTIVGEGVGVVVLKRLKDALRDGDHIHAVIKGSAVNNDGRQKVSFTAPSVDGQYSAIVKAMNMAKVSPESIGYVETHGTATRLGDAIESEALKLSFGKSQEKYCGLGSVKSNIGHLDTAAGIAGFIKAVLAIKNRQIPPSLHFRNLNPEIDFNESPFYVNNVLRPWKRGKFPLRAGVSSFGIGGTNAHVILEEAPEVVDGAGGRAFQLLVWSARTEESLGRSLGNFSQYLQQNPGVSIPDMAYTLQTGRSSFEYRRIIVCSGREDALQQLSVQDKGGRMRPVAGGSDPMIVFLFPGQGSQYVNMCRDLYREEVLFRAEVDGCFEIVRRLSGKDLAAVLFPAGEVIEAERINETEYAQPLLFIVEYALARIMMKWGIAPAMMIGHSIGEYVAACIGGVFTLEDALRLVLKRGALMQKAARGKMLSISISEEKLRALMEGREGISLAAINSPELCVVSGTEEAVHAFKGLLEEQGIVSKYLHTSHAFHSAMMDEILDEFAREVARVRIQPIRIPFISNLTGKEATDADLSQPSYWADHLRHTVRFSAGISLLAKRPAVFIEAGPGKGLSMLVRGHSVDKEQKVVRLVRSTQEAGNDNYYLLKGLGELWLGGVKPDWRAFYEQEVRKRISLPTYSFDKISYPVNVNSLSLLSERVSRMVPREVSAKFEDVSKWLYTPSWKLMPEYNRGVRGSDGKTVLFFADPCGISEALGLRYAEGSGRIVYVRAGNAFNEETPFSYQIAPGNSHDYRVLFARLAGYDLLPDKIVHAWGITRDVEDSYSDREFDRYFYSLLEAMRSVHAQGGGVCREISLLTSDLYRVLDKGVTSSILSLSSGLLKVISQEFPSVHSHHIDISLSEELSGEWTERLFAAVQTVGRGKVVCLRHSQQWEQLYEAIGAGGASSSSFRRDGVYLITGGLGAFGFAIAGALLSEAKAKVILLGRASLASREEWALPRMRRLQMLEAQGDVMYLDCDITDAGDLRRVVGIAEERFGVVNGVFHAAGVINGSSISPVNDLTKMDIREQFEPKVGGLIALREVFKDRDLDFCLLTSSLAAVLGGIGFGAYASANAFMDHYIRGCRERGELRGWTSLNLDGLDLEHEVTSVINKKELLEVIQEALSLGDLPQVVVSVTDLNKRLREWVQREEERSEDGDADDDVSLATAGVEAGTMGEVEIKLLALWNNYFGREDIGVDDDFFEIGGDSLKALTMIGRTHKALHVDVPFREFFTRPTIRQLSEYIQSVREANLSGVSPDLVNDNGDQYYVAI